MKLIVHPDAEDEALDATLYYQDIEPSLGDDVWQQYWKIIEALEERPERFPLLETIRTQTIRRARLSRFPFMVVYEVVADDVFVLAFAHTARKPNYWRSRRGRR